MSIKNDLEKYPVFVYNYINKTLIELDKPVKIPFGFTAHHFIRTQWIRNNPEIYEKVVHLQKLFLLPTCIEGYDNMHLELHNRHRHFKEKWGYEIEDLLWDEQI